MTEPSLASVCAALALVVALALGAGWLARLRGSPGLSARSARDRRLSVEAALSLDGRRRLLLVSCDGRTGVLLLAQTGDTFLGWQDQAVTAARFSVEHA